VIYSLESAACRLGIEFSAPTAPREVSSVFEQAFKNIDDVLWKEAGCTTELDYTEQTSWLCTATIIFPV